VAAQNISWLWNDTASIQKAVRAWETGVVELTDELKKERNLTMNDYGTNVIAPIKWDLVEIIAEDAWLDMVKDKKIITKLTRGMWRSQRMLDIVWERAIKEAWEIDHILAENEWQKVWASVWTCLWWYDEIEAAIYDWRNLNRIQKNVIDGKEFEDLSQEEKDKVVKKIFYIQKNVHPFTSLTKSLPSTQMYHLLAKYGMTWWSRASGEACAAWPHAVANWYDQITMWRRKLMMVGWVESSISNSGLGKFWKMWALSKAINISDKDNKVQIDDVMKASRPFQQWRDGFVMWEGANMIVLEDMESAIERSATILCEVLWYWTSSDPSHVTAPNKDGKYAAMAIDEALVTSGITPDQVDAIIMHGTSTPKWDLAETNAVKRVFWTTIPKLISAKWGTGHLLWASWTDAIVQAVHMMLGQYVPPTANLERLDNDISDVMWEDSKQFVMWETLYDMKVEYVIVNSFWFWWTNISVLLKRWVA